jgi:histidinol-phosphate phosphatase family protein
VNGHARALFLDRDGVINRRRPDHVKSWAEFEFLPGAVTGLALLRRMGIRVVVITNQAVVGRGLLHEDELLTIHQRMAAAVSADGGQIERVYTCLHVPQAGCRCRKPATALLEQASVELGISLPDSIMAGDSRRDLDAARAVGCRPVYIGDSAGLAVEPDVSCARDLVDLAGLVSLLTEPVKAC